MQILPTIQPASPAAALVLRQHPEGPRQAGQPADAATPALARDGTTPQLVCAACGHPITTDAWRIPVEGSHHHVFANPYGLVFPLECFAAAPGCAMLGPLTADFSWFAGTSWQLAVCAVCRLHLGWRYERASGGGIFFGLIPQRLQRQTDDLA